MGSDVSLTPQIGALLRLVWQWAHEKTVDGVHAAGYSDVTSAHLALMRYASVEGLRPVDIAGRMQITRQSVHELLTHMEQHGYLARESHASDTRARVVRLTAIGRRLELEIRAQAGAVETHIAALIGEQRLTELRAGLLALAAEIGAARNKP